MKLNECTATAESFCWHVGGNISKRSMKLIRPFWDVSPFWFVDTMLDYLFGKTSALACHFSTCHPLLLRPFLRVGDLEQGIRVGQKGTAQKFVHPPTTTLELENDREYKIQMETRRHV